MKFKLNIAYIIVLTTLSMNVFSQDPSQERKNATPDFEKTKGEMISFHMLKVVDHQKVVDCLKKSESFESMNGCNKYLEKYLRKEEVKEEEDKK